MGRRVALEARRRIWQELPQTFLAQAKSSGLGANVLVEMDLRFTVVANLTFHEKGNTQRPA
jgi:hypothetical protein